MAKSKFKLGFKAFFKSLWADFVGLCKKHLWRLAGFVVSFIVPIVWLIVNYCTSIPDGEKTKFTIPFAVILPLAILTIVYWVKLKDYMQNKVVMMRTENNIEKGKHAGMLILCDMVKAVFTVVPFLLVYIIIRELEKYVQQLSDIFLFMIICESVGALFVIFDTIHNVIDFDSEEIKELAEEVIEKKESKK